MTSIESTNNSLLESSAANATTTLPYEESEKGKQIPDFAKFLAVVFGLIILIGLAGNILTVAVILRNKGIKSITDILVMNLAVTDILFIVFSVPMTMVSLVISHLPFGNVSCRLINYVTYACDYASMYMLVLVSLDRYLALVYPIRAMSLRTKRNCYRSLTVIWSVILLGNIPLLFEDQFCFVSGKWKKSFMQILIICLFVFEFMLPLILMCVLYGHILKSFHTGKIPGVNNTTSRVRLLSNRRVTKMVIIVVMVFIICRLPFHIMSLCLAFGNYFENVVFVILFMVVSCMLYLNCCINPILYRFHSKTFRKGCWDVLSCKN